MTSAPPISRQASRRGLTLLEVTLATVILGLVAAVGMGSLNYIIAQSDRQQARLGAMELANRLMIIFLDDEVEFSKLPRELPYEGRDFRWSVAQANVGITPVAVGDVANSIRSGERLRNIAIEVWLAESSGGDREPGAGTPSARLVRMVDIFNKNPDSVQFMVTNEEARRAFISRATDLTRRAGTGRRTPPPQQGSTTPNSTPTQPVQPTGRKS